MKIDINLRSQKKRMNLEDIIIPDKFKATPPKMKKVIVKAFWHGAGFPLDPIIVDGENVIIDGYISYLIKKAMMEDCVGIGEDRKVEAYQIKVGAK